MRILLTGGGTGGHITPLLAVAERIKQQHPTSHIIYVGERNGKFAHLTDRHAAIDEVYTVYSGKFRRYHGESFLQHLFDFKTIFLNVRDSLYFLFGIMQSWWLLGRIRPDSIFLKGGFVGVPIGIAAALRKMPFLTHDSDAVPGLANRLVARWASIHATALPPEVYGHYSQEKVRHVGVIVSENYRSVTQSKQKDYKRQLNIPATANVLLITGGSLGAVRLNRAIRKRVTDLLENDPKLHIIHQVGKGNSKLYNGFTHDRLHIFEFLEPMHIYTGAADVVVTRAGANTLAELGVQGKVCIVVPNPKLTGGHQIKNAELLEANGAAIVMNEAELQTDGFMRQLRSLLAPEAARQRSEIGKRFKSMTRRDAAERIADLLIGMHGGGAA